MQRIGYRTGRRLAALAALLTVALAAGPSLVAQQGAKNGEWRSWAGDTGSTRYSPLDQINAANFSTLEVAWRFKTDILGPRPDFNLQATPLMINGVLYFTAGEHRDACLLYTSPSPRDRTRSRMPSSA